MRESVLISPFASTPFLRLIPHGLALFLGYLLLLQSFYTPEAHKGTIHVTSESYSIIVWAAPHFG